MQRLQQLLLLLLQHLLWQQRHLLLQHLLWQQWHL
jgi:hypothetical protein